MDQAAGQPIRPEFSRRLEVRKIAPAGEMREIEANAHECALLAERFGLLGLDALRATLEVKPLAGGPVIRVSGPIHAEVVQACVVTLEPVAGTVETRLDQTFAPARAIEPEVEFDPDAPDPPEAFVHGAIDLGEAVVQQFAVSLNPYPRAPDVVLPDAVTSEEDAEPELVNRPFADLKNRLKPGQ